MHAKRRGRVDDAGRILAFENADGLLRGVVGQAEDGDVGFLQQVGAQIEVAALGFGYRQDCKIVARRQPRPDLQAGCAVFAIDEDFRFHDLSFR